jgi:hypothetical protein
MEGDASYMYVLYKKARAAWITQRNHTTAEKEGRLKNLSN